MLIRPDSAPDTDDYYGLQLFSNNGGNDLFIGKTGASLNYGLEVSQNGVFTQSLSATAATQGEGVLLVARVDFNADTTAGAPETFSLYVNPTPGAAEPTMADAMLSFDLGAQNGLAFNSGNGASVSFDELRIGTTYASVTPANPVPEPASAALVACGGLLLLRRRR